MLTILLKLLRVAPCSELSVEVLYVGELKQMLYATLTLVMYCMM
jgi:hypothetical protein